MFFSPELSDAELKAAGLSMKSCPPLRELPGILLRITQRQRDRADISKGMVGGSAILTLLAAPIGTPAAVTTQFAVHCWQDEIGLPPNLESRVAA